jgi:hypothetical protein
MPNLKIWQFCFSFHFVSSKFGNSASGPNLESSPNLGRQFFFKKKIELAVVFLGKTNGTTPNSMAVVFLGKTTILTPKELYFVESILGTQIYAVYPYLRAADGSRKRSLW